MHTRVSLDQLVDQILAGIRNACDDTVEFTEDFAGPVGAEYLFSVYVAKAISQLNSGLGWPLKIFIEKNALDFKRACTPPLAKEVGPNPLLAKSIPRGRVPLVRPGRIDVAVMRDGLWGPIPVCAVELKGFNPPRSRVMEDLQRNAEYFEAGATGASEIELTVFATVRSYRKTASQESRVRRVLERQAASVTIPSGTSTRVTAVRIRDGSGDEDGWTPQLVVGMVVFSRPAPTTPG